MKESTSTEDETVSEKPMNKKPSANDFKFVFAEKLVLKIASGSGTEFYSEPPLKLRTTNFLQIACKPLSIFKLKDIIFTARLCLSFAR